MGDIADAPQQYGEWMRAGGRQGAVARNSFTRPETFNPICIELRHNKYSEDIVRKGIRLFQTGSSRPDMKTSRSDVEDWRKTDSRSNNLSMSDLQQCVTKEFGGRAESHQPNRLLESKVKEWGKKEISNSKESRDTIVDALQRAGSSKAIVDLPVSLQSLASSLTDVGVLEQLVQGTLDATEADMVC